MIVGDLDLGKKKRPWNWQEQGPLNTNVAVCVVCTKFRVVLNKKTQELEIRSAVLSVHNSVFSTRYNQENQVPKKRKRIQTQKYWHETWNCRCTVRNWSISIASTESTWESSARCSVLWCRILPDGVLCLGDNATIQRDNTDARKQVKFFGGKSSLKCPVAVWK